MKSNIRSIANDPARAIARNPRFALKALAVSLMIAFGANVYALPVGGVVAEGGAGISSGAGTTTINQTSQNVAINWQSFSIGVGEAVQFVQPNSSSIALNRVLGPDPSSILGNLSANGKVFLLNPNGVLFGHGAQVNVGGLVASTLNMSDGDFMAGRYHFAGNSKATVLNQGTINAPGGYVALLGAEVGNDGIILARLGTVALAAGSEMTLDVAGDGLLNVTVSQGAVDALVQNGGLIQADGGQVLLTAKAAGNLLQSAVNNTGVIQAQTIENRNGTIRLLGDMRIGTANVDGTLDASAPNGGDGGFIETSAAQVFVKNTVRVTTAAAGGKSGLWLIDPLDFTVGSVPGDNIDGATLSGNVQNGDITITTVAGPGAGNGDIFITEPITWDGMLGISAAPTTLTLNALGSVYIGRRAPLGLLIPTAVITPTNGNLVMVAGQNVNIDAAIIPTDGSATITAGLDVNIDAAISPTRGNLVVCCGQDINVNEAITTVNGSVLLSAGRDVNVIRSLANNATAITTTDGNIEICAGGNITLENTFFAPLAPLITLTRGSTTGGQDLATLGVPLGLTLRAGTGATGPGAAGGTLIVTNIGVANTFITLTTGIVAAPVSIFYNPVSYAAPTDYSLLFTGTGGPLTQFMLVFPDGANRTFVAGSTAAAFTGLKVDALGALPPGVTLVQGGIANFDTPAVGNDKLVTFTGFGLTQPNAVPVPGGLASNYDFAKSCCALPTVGRTRASIIAAPPQVPPVPPGGVPGPEAEEMMGPEYLAPAAVLGVAPSLMPNVELAGLPPQLLSIAPVPVPPVVQPPPPVQEPPPVYVPPVRPPKQDRN
ncbi:MAG: filamentous hemagglutinin N-terminal domain-containing protein [Sulfuritalea sp.]|nr:filamentous hemagglutinin N-terminal domain-containing protein [Sulfuritalea sp.]